MKLNIATGLAILVLAMTHASWVPGFAQNGTESKVYGGLSMQNLQLPKGKHLISLTIDLESGSFDTVSNMPAGWQFTINNDSPGRATLEARANATSRALDEHDLDNIALEIIKNDQSGKAFRVDGEYVVTSDSGREKRVPLDHYNFDFTERYPRHRLTY